MEPVFKNLVERMREIQEKKKNNFVFNYLAYSFEKGMKYYMIKWKRIIKKISLQQFYLNQDEDDDVVDVEEERRKIAELKNNSIIVKRFRNVMYRNLRAKISTTKNSFLLWRNNALRLKIIALKQKRMLKQLQEKGVTQIPTGQASQEVSFILTSRPFNLKQLI
jgi:hypothetical protein